MYNRGNLGVDDFTRFCSTAQPDLHGREQNPEAQEGHWRYNTDSAKR